MNLRRLDLNLLVVLNALLQDRSTTLAAKKLNLSQSAVSGSLARLRDYFGDELLVQVGRKMQPTPLGATLAEPVQAVLLQIQSTIQIRPSFDPLTAQRHFRLKMSDYAATVLIPEFLPRLEQLAPKVSIELQGLNLGSPTGPLERGEIDFLVMPTFVLSPQHPQEILFDDTQICIAWSGNTAIGPELSLDRYLALGHVVLQFPSGGAQAQNNEWLQTVMHFNRRVEVIAMNFASLVQCVVGTQRIATIQKRLAEYYARHLPIKLIPTPFVVPEFTESLQWNRNSDADPGSLWLRGLLKEVAARPQGS